MYHKILPGWVAFAFACLCVWMMADRSNRFEDALMKFKREAVQRGAATLQYNPRGEVFLQWKDDE